MAHLIGLGNENDKTALPLATAQGTRIPNSRRGELAPEQMREAVRIVLENHEQRILRRGVIPSEKGLLSLASPRNERLANRLFHMETLGQ